MFNKLITPLLLLLLTLLSIQLVTRPAPALAGDNGGNSLDFDGSDDYVDLGLISEMNNQSTLTIEMWVRPKTLNSGSMMLNRNAGICFGRVGLFFDGGTNLHFAVESGSCAWGLTTTGNIQAGQWYHIAGVYDGTQAGNANRMQIYINGVAQNITFNGTIPSQTFNSTDTTRLAVQTAGFYGDNEIDEVRIWDVARTQSQIQANMFNASIPGTEMGLVAYYRLDESAGTTASDETGTYPGTLMNMDPSTDWLSSTAPIGDAAANGQNDLAAMWAGNTPASSAGLILTNSTFLQDLGDDIIFGHDNQTGSTNTDLPTVGDWAAAPDPVRWQRVYYLDKSDLGTTGGDVSFTFDFVDAGLSQGPPLPPASNYRLLYRAGTSGPFADVATASGTAGDQVAFNALDTLALNNGYYTLGSLDGNTSPTQITLSGQQSNNPGYWPGLVLVSVFVLLAIATFLLLRRGRFT